MDVLVIDGPWLAVLSRHHHMSNPPFWVVGFVPRDEGSCQSRFFQKLTVEGFLRMFSCLQVATGDFPTPLGMLDEQHASTFPHFCTTLPLTGDPRQDKPGLGRCHGITPCRLEFAQAKAQPNPHQRPATCVRGRTPTAGRLVGSRLPVDVHRGGVG